MKKSKIAPTAQSVNDRMDTMSKWATGVSTQIAELHERLTTSSLTRADEVAAELGSLHAAYSGVLGEMSTQAERRAGIASELTGEGGVESQMADAEATVYLEICAEMTPGNKPRYKNDKERAAAYQRALIANEEYRSLSAEAESNDAAKLRQREIEAATEAAVRDDILLVERYSNDTKREAAVRLRLQTDPAYTELHVRKRDLELEDAHLRAQFEHEERLWSEYGRRERALVAQLGFLTARLS